MAETQEIQATEAHYGLLVDIDQGKVFDQHVSGLGERSYLRIIGAQPKNVSWIVWDLEALGWARRPANSPYWQLTHAGRAAMEGSGL